MSKKYILIASIHYFSFRQKLNSINIIQCVLYLLVFSSICFSQQKIDGITLVAPPKEIDSNAIIRLAKTNAEWICLVPYGFVKEGNPDIRYNLERQWWGERVEGIAACAKLAQSQGLKVMLKPQLFMGHKWIGEMTFDNDADWLKWEHNYRTFIFEFLLPNIPCDILCIGTELNKSIEQRPVFWKQLIADVKKNFKGQITYSSNWDQYQKVSFWSDLDFVGISSYFPITDTKFPSVTFLKTKWKPIVSTLKKYSLKVKKPILFTEYGYLTVEGCTGKSWELEKNIDLHTKSEKAQANAFEALYQSLYHESWWAGGFIWKWFPNNMGHEGYPEKDYTPQDKEAEVIVKNWFSKI